MRVPGVLVASLVLLAAVVGPAQAFNCPVVIKQAEEVVRKAAAGKPTADTRPLIDEAKKFLGEARAHHENARTKRDHGDAVRKARFAIALAEEAITLQGP